MKLNKHESKAETILSYAMWILVGCIVAGAILAIIGIL
jgi:hypothetical protein